MNKIAYFFLLIPMLLLTSAGQAHHSTAIYDSDNPIELQGRVVEWQFTNPHTFVILAVADENEEEVVWSLEGSNTSIMFRRGWTPESMQPGDEIIITVRPLHSGAPGGNYRNIRNSDGTPFGPKATR